MKDMNNIGSIIKITSSKHTVKFFCDAGSVYSREVVFGDEKNEKEDEMFIEFSLRYQEISQIIFNIIFYVINKVNLYVRICSVCLTNTT